MPRRSAWILMILMTAACTASAQPAVDIHLLAIERAQDRIHFGPPLNASDHPGYDNQPCFWPSDSARGPGFYFTSIREGGQADIYVYEIAERRVRRITRTPESEYSPTALAGGGFSTVRVEADSTQRLWEFPVDGEPRLINPNVRGVGYHAWIGPDDLMLFVLGDPHELHRARRGDAPSVRVIGDIGRSMALVPGRAAGAFTQPRGDDQWRIRVLDLDTGGISDLTDAPGSSQDFAWTPQQSLWMVDDSRLMEWSADAGWAQIHDFAAAGLSGITRLAVSDDGRWLALVAAESGADDESR